MNACRNSRKFAFCKILYSTLFSTTYFCQGGCRPPSRKAFCAPKALRFQPCLESCIHLCHKTWHHCKSDALQCLRNVGIHWLRLVAGAWGRISCVLDAKKRELIVPVGFLAVVLRKFHHGRDLRATWHCFGVWRFECSFSCEFMTPCVVKLVKLGSLCSLVRLQRFLLSNELGRGKWSRTQVEKRGLGISL